VRAAPAHESRHAELSAAMDDEELTAPSADELEAMRATVRHGGVR